MLKLRPNCECCDKDLPADAADALICTFEVHLLRRLRRQPPARRPLPELQRRTRTPSRAAAHHAGEIPGVD